MKAGASREDLTGNVQVDVDRKRMTGVNADLVKCCTAVVIDAQHVSGWFGIRGVNKGENDNETYGMKTERALQHGRASDVLPESHTRHNMASFSAKCTGQGVGNELTRILET